MHIQRIPWRDRRVERNETPVPAHSVVILSCRLSFFPVFCIFYVGATTDSSIGGCFRGGEKKFDQLQADGVVGHEGRRCPARGAYCCSNANIVLAVRPQTVQCASQSRRGRCRKYCRLCLAYGG